MLSIQFSLTTDVYYILKHIYHVVFRDIFTAPDLQVKLSWLITGKFTGKPKRAVTWSLMWFIITMQSRVLTLNYSCWEWCISLINLRQQCPDCFTAKSSWKSNRQTHASICTSFASVVISMASEYICRQQVTSSRYWLLVSVFFNLVQLILACRKKVSCSTR